MYWRDNSAPVLNQQPVSSEVAEAARAALAVAADKVRNLATAHPDHFPLYTDQGKWRHGKESWTNWCEGFLGGQMWIFAEHGLGDDWAARAEHYAGLVEDRQHDCSVHDLGFVLAPTWKKKAELSGDDAAKKVAVQGGQTLAKRFNSQGRYLRSFLAEDSLFIDIMMNVGLIFWTARETGDDELLAVARQHSATTRRYLVRGDGSVSHEGIFDLETGEFLRQTTQQGWRNDSAWARGLAWSLYGFTSIHGLDPNRHWMDTARANAQFWIEHTSGTDLVPPNDFDEPSPARRWESSAAAAAAGGLLQLARLVPDPAESRHLHQHAEATFLRLCDPEFLAAGDQAWEGVLKHGSYHETKDLGVDESVMWGDYFFVELAHELAIATSIEGEQQ
jgi:unsaturated chondroitin disaccharide hydrolase